MVKTILEVYVSQQKKSTDIKSNQKSSTQMWKSTQRKKIAI